MTTSRTPVLVGAAAVSQRESQAGSGDDAIGLMIRAAESAAVDAGAGALLSRIDWALVPQGGWAWPDPARLVTDAVGSPHARTTFVELGILQQTLFTRAIESIQRGHTDVVLIAGAEARYRDVMHRKATGEPAPVREQPEAHPNSRWKPEQEILSRTEIERLLATPAHQYAIIENARRALDGQTIPEHTSAVADLWSRFSQVAAANPDAWRREPMAASDAAGRVRGQSVDGLAVHQVALLAVERRPGRGLPALLDRGRRCAGHRC